MVAPLEFWFDFSSPYGYLASYRIDAIGEEAGREVLWRPYLLGVVFKSSGQSPLVSQPMRGAYHLKDMQRAARRQNVPLVLPEGFPMATIAACRVALRDGVAANMLLRALKSAGAQGVLFGVFNDAAVAARAHRLGEGATLTASFNSQEHHEFSLPFDCEARVVKLSDGKYVGRRGLAKNMSCDMGPSALLGLDGIQVVVITHRCQCMDPMQFELFGLDIAQARVVVVKSRGHFRSGFDEFFRPEQVYEVDCPGLTSPVLANFNWTGLPRPVYPLDEETAWSPPSTV